MFQEPGRVVHPPSWLEHSPFAFWMVEALRPATFVELGTHSGNSYACFAQAVQMLGLPTACYAVDTWQGDSQAGFYTDDVFNEWSAYHDRHFSAFSRLIRSTFAEASHHFSDHSIDLLHSDGCHTAESLSVDLETWRPKMSRNGVILIHDINVREGDFGAWRIWEELKKQGPAFEFLHGHGLGVLAIGSEMPEALQWLFSTSEQDTQLVRQFFARLGGAIASRFAATEDRFRKAAEHEQALLTASSATTELQRQLRSEEDRRVQAELTCAEQQSAISQLTVDLADATAQGAKANSELDAHVERSKQAADRILALEEQFEEEKARRERELLALTKELEERETGHKETLARTTRLVAELSGRLRSESDLRRQAEAARARRAAIEPVSGARLRTLRTQVDLESRRRARSLLTLRRTAAQAGLGTRSGRRPVGGLIRMLTRPKRLLDAHRIVLSGLFDEPYYLHHHPDVARSLLSPLAHFVLRGAFEGRSPHPLFDIGYYQRTNPDVASSPLNPLVHYLLHGAFEGRRPHPLFDPAYYLETNPDVRALRIEPLAHFVRFGAREGRKPNPFFDCAYYLGNNPDVADSGTNPLVHFDRNGWREGRRCSAAFDTSYYLEKNRDVRSAHQNPLAHYIEHGRREGRPAVAPNEAAEVVLPDFSGATMSVRSLAPVREEKATVLCLTHVMPIPPRAGNEYRIYRMLRWLRDQGYRIIPVIAPLPGEPCDAAAVQALADEFSNGILCDRDGTLKYVLGDVPDNLSSLAGEPARAFAPLLGEEFVTDRRERQLLQFDRIFCHDPVMTAVLHLQHVLGRHVFLAEYIWMSRILPFVSGNVLKVVDTIDAFSTKRAKVLEFGIDDLHVEPEQEATRLLDADLVLAIQDDERRELLQIVGHKPVLTVGVDFDVDDDAGTPSARSVLYVASNNPLNKKGLRDFLRFAWPDIRNAVPDAELLVAGPISQSVSDDVPGVVRLGRVADLRPYYRRTRLVINPAVAGTGVKIKTLEALSHLRPIVTWPNGADGLHPDLAALCVIARDWYEFGQLVTQLLATEAPRAFSRTECDAVRHLTSPAVAYGALTAALAEFFKGHEPPG